MSDEVLTVGYYLDMIVKGAAAVGVALIGWFCKKTDDRLASLEDKGIDKSERILILEESRKHHHNQVNIITARLLEIDRKLDIIAGKKWGT